jgi:Kef-type K+ transport system membrane component KefB
MPLSAIQAPSGVVLEFLVLFGVILIGPMVVRRLGLPGLIGLLLGGFVIGPHGLALIAAGNDTVPALGQLGLLYLMFVAGLELDLHLLSAYRRAAVLIGLMGFSIPFTLGLSLGFGLGWSVPATCLLGALVSSYTLIVYPTLRDAGLGGNPAIASAVGATVLTDTLALSVLAVVAGTQSGTGSPAVLLAEIVIGLIILIVVGLLVLPRAVDVVMRRSGGDRVGRYLVMLFALLLMAALAQVFGIEGIVGAFFAGIGLNRLVPNRGPSMEPVEFFGSAVFVPLFVVSIGLLLDPSVMFKPQTLALAAAICGCALGGKAIASWFAGSFLGFTRPERAGMYALTVPQAAATLAATLVGFQIGLFGVTLVNAVLVLIVVSITTGALLAQKVVTWIPAAAGAHRPLGEKVLVVTTSAGPSDAAMRAARRLARPDGGHGEVVIARTDSDPRPAAAALRAIEQRIFGHGLDGRLTTTVDTLPHAVRRATLASEPSIVIADDPDFDTPIPDVPLIVVAATAPAGGAFRLIGPFSDDSVAEVRRRLRDGEKPPRRLRRDVALPNRTASAPSSDEGETTGVGVGSPDDADGPEL